MDRQKVVDYLLNPAHPGNGGKSRFFNTLGFSSDDPEALIRALCAVAATGDVVARSDSAHGEKYVVDGPLMSQTGRYISRIVRTVWIIERGQKAPRLVTAYPGEKK